MWYRLVSDAVKRSLPILLLLSKPDLALCSVSQTKEGSTSTKYHHQTCEKTAIEKRSVQSEEAVNMAETNGKNGLLLYYNEYSFYSQKVVLALYEKNLKFETRSIELSGEQYKPWFLQINPRGEVPVLQDTGKIIPDSARIIDYLEDNFSNGDTPRLIPMDQGDEVRQKVVQFRSLIDKINGNHLTIGSFLHPELATGSKKVPFIGPVRTQLMKADEDNAAELRKFAAENPEAREMLMEKATNQEKKREKLLNKDEFLKLVKDTDNTLDKVEAELAEHTEEKKHWWLCTDRFTVADVSLTILLVRLNQIGMEPHFWTGGKRPNVENYFNRVQQRESYKKTIPTTFSLIATIVKTKLPWVIGVSIVVVLSLVVGGWFLVRRLRNKN